MLDSKFTYYDQSVVFSLCMCPNYLDGRFPSIHRAALPSPNTGAAVATCVRVRVRVRVRA